MTRHQQKRNPLPAVHAPQGHGRFLLAHGEPHEACPVAGCHGLAHGRSTPSSWRVGLGCYWPS